MVLQKAILISLITFTITIGQTLYNKVGHIPTEYQLRWTKAGLLSNTPKMTDYILDVTDYGATPDNASNDDYYGIRDAIDEAARRSGLTVIYFPSGTYNIFTSIMLEDPDAESNIVFQGEGTSGSNTTILKFVVGPALNCFKIQGNQSSMVSLTGDIPKDSKTLKAASFSTIGENQWIRLSEYDFDVEDSWAVGTVGQITKLVTINGDGTATMKDSSSKEYLDSNDLRIWKINPMINIGFEDLRIERSEPNYSSTGTNIVILYAVNCWFKGVEFYNTCRSHLDVRFCSHLEISGCYFNHAIHHGNGGYGYGVVLNFSTTNCLVENSIFRDLRHSIVVQGGPNCNVFTYNYSREEKAYNDDLGIWYHDSDVTLHGNYPFGNLFEHNFVAFIEADDAHGQNGMYNAFVRNRIRDEEQRSNDVMTLDECPYSAVESMEIYPQRVPSSYYGGLFVAGSTSLTLDLYGFDNDNDQTHQQVHNNGNRSSCYNEDVSYYYTKRPYFLTAPYTFPTIGPKETSSSSQTTQSIPAKERFNTSTKTFVIKTQ